ncbi:MAG: 1-deoxy-D-xylulose 5-phosphate reductoisomerase [Microgenomates group bacterium GW2011_GWA2_47_8]|nr:MAG: 1-deoxy-D-xylulose 5-phosphate reductoisomerase [Microgenomates group bacterium GW2011_GWA2_47_8]
MKSFPEELQLVAIAAGCNVELLNEQIHDYNPRYVGLTRKDLKDTIINVAGQKVLFGTEALAEIATLQEVDIVVVATSGTVALLATVAAIKAGKTIALANKETLVTAGELVMPLVKARGAELRTVDSEHSAIWQCLIGEDVRAVKRLILTASGGAFRDYSLEQLRDATPEQALKHPNWNMGRQITVDSTTLMNKGLEVIEAHWLFDLPYQQISVLVHRESIVHSMVEFHDGSIKAQLAVADMRLPIQFALMYPSRLKGLGQEAYLDWSKVSQLNFTEPDLVRFPGLKLGYEVGVRGGTYPAALVGADEVVVEAFLKGKIGFMDIPALLKTVLGNHQNAAVSLETIQGTIEWARAEALSLCQQRRRTIFM